MKKLLLILLLLIIALLAWFYFTKQTPRQSLTSELTNAVIESPPLQPETNLTEVASNTVPVEAVQQPANVIETTTPLTNALTATNIEQWEAAIKDLKPLAGFKLKQDWMMEKTNRLDGVPVVFQQNGNTVSLKARFIDITAKNGTGDIIEVGIHSPIMDIAETRDLGLQLCNIFGLDSGDFLAWCNKVGNHWLDAPLYETRDIHDPNSSAVFAFKTMRTYTDEKPWFINFIIMPNP